MKGSDRVILGGLSSSLEVASRDAPKADFNPQHDMQK
jgi:hypothetical protein